MSDKDHVTVTKDGYKITFHPAFSSGCSVEVKGEDGTQKELKELYKQKGKHHLNGAPHPKKHVFRISGGKHNRDLSLEIDDPKHHVARITIELYEEGHEPGWGKKSSQPIEIVTYDNNGTTCPPDCEDPG